MEKSSVYADGEQEALRYKWIESEKAGHDLGEAAILVSHRTSELDGRRNVGRAVEHDLGEPLDRVRRGAHSERRDAGARVGALWRAAINQRIRHERRGRRRWSAVDVDEAERHGRGVPRFVRRASVV